MNTSKFSLLVLAALLSAPVLAEDGGSFKAQIFSADSHVTIEGIQVSGLGGFSRDINNTDEDRHLSSVGGGAAFESSLGEPLRVGVGLGYISYPGEANEPGFRDLIGNAYASIDFVDQDVIALYGMGGISYHNLSLENFERDGVELSSDSTGLLNYDLGLGARFKLNYSTTFGLEYKYTSTFSKNDIDLKLKGASLAYDGLKYKNVGIQNNELVASLGFNF